MNTFRRLVASEKPLVLPVAHDAISAQLIQRAGFKAYFIGGFPLVGARYGVPDIGLMGLGEVGAGIRDIMAASELPVLVDCDNGYGDGEDRRAHDQLLRAPWCAGSLLRGSDFT